MIQDLLPKELSEKIKNEEVIVIDIRDERSYFYGHIPGAIHIPKSDIHQHEHKEIFDTNKQIVIYCYIGLSSLEVIESLIEVGYDSDKFFNLKGGITQWNTEGYIVVVTPNEIKLDVK